MGILRQAIIACLGPGPYEPRALAIAAWVGAFFALALIPAPLLARLAPGWFVWHPENLPGLFVPVVAKALKEEAMFRALPYALLCLWWKRMGHRTWLLSGALVFALAHEINFTLLRQDPLTLPTLATLFFFGILTGALFLRQGHIGGCLAIHAGWNLMRFQLHMRVGGRPLSVGEGFHLIEGHPAMVGLSFLCAVALTWGLRDAGKGAARGVR